MGCSGRFHINSSILNILKRTICTIYTLFRKYNLHWPMSTTRQDNHDRVVLVHVLHGTRYTRPCITGHTVTYQWSLCPLIIEYSCLLQKTEPWSSFKIIQISRFNAEYSYFEFLDRMAISLKSQKFANLLRGRMAGSRRKGIQNKNEKCSISGLQEWKF